MGIYRIDMLAWDMRWTCIFSLPFAVSSPIGRFMNLANEVSLCTWRFWKYASCVNQPQLYSSTFWLCIFSLRVCYWTASGEPFGQKAPRCGKTNHYGEMLPSADTSGVHRAILLDCCEAVKASGRRSQWQNAFWLVAQLREKKVTGDLILHNSLISACQKASQWNKALLLLSEQPINSMQSSVISYNASISSCATSAWSIAMILVHSMAMQRDVITFNSAMSADGVAWPWAFQLITELRCEELQPTAVSCISAMTMVGQWDVALQFLAMDFWQADVMMYSAGINACGKCQEQCKDDQR